VAHHTEGREDAVGGVDAPLVVVRQGLDLLLELERAALAERSVERQRAGRASSDGQPAQNALVVDHDQLVAHDGEVLKDGHVAVVVELHALQGAQLGLELIATHELRRRLGRDRDAVLEGLLEGLLGGRLGGSGGGRGGCGSIRLGLLVAACGDAHRASDGERGDGESAQATHQVNLLVWFAHVLSDEGRSSGKLKASASADLSSRLRLAPH